MLLLLLLRMMMSRADWLHVSTLVSKLLESAPGRELATVSGRKRLGESSVRPPPAICIIRSRANRCLLRDSASQLAEIEVEA